MSKGFIKNIANFRDNRVADYVAKYLKGGDFYNLGWGNLNSEMLKYGIPRINFDKDLIGRYNDARGLDHLVDEIIGFIHKKSGTKLERGNILITNGATNAIFLVSSFFRDSLGMRSVLMQNPTFDTAINIFRSQSYTIETVNPGIGDLSKKRPKLAYLIFKFQNPTGVSIPKEDRNALRTELLKTGYLIEDDAYGLLEDNSKIDLVDHERYLYLGSFSKYIFPGLRMGYIIGGKEIVGKLRIVQKYYNSHPSILSQLILLDYLGTGRIYKEIEHKVKVLTYRHKIFNGSLVSSELEEFVWPNCGGFYYWAKLPRDIDMETMFSDLLRANILVIPGDIYFVRNKYSAIRMSLSTIGATDIPAAVNKLSEVIGKYA